MIGKMELVERVKKLREDKALRALTAAQSSLSRAQNHLDKLRAQIEDSAQTLPARARAVFAPIMTKVTPQSKVDDAKRAVLHLEESHQRLVDRGDRALAARDRARDALDEARAAHRQAQANVEKITTLLEDLRSKAAIASEHRQEAEIEDVVTGAAPRKSEVAA